jgi:hypothetical protein
MTKNRSFKPELSLQEDHHMLPISIPKDVANDLQNMMNRITSEKELSSENIIYIVSSLMSVVGKYKKLSGIEKKEIVILFINNIIDNSKLDNTVKISLQLSLSTIVPNAIDILVDISHGKYKFKYIPHLYKWMKSLNCACCSK